jgi:uncharacterized protein involved in oxidation of intracellular sulfur
MKLLITLSTADPETAFNAFRLASFARTMGDAVNLFLIGKGVDIEHAADERFDVRGQAEKLLSAGGIIQACGTCLKIRNSNGSEVCPLSTMQTLYDLIACADRIVSF